MKISVNGKGMDLEAGTIEHLLTALGYDRRFVAVAINFTCVARSQFASTEIHEGDEVEVLSPQSGG